MIALYNLILFLIIIISSPIILLSILFFKKLKIEIKERLCFIDKNIILKLKGKKLVWFHAASVGEVIAVASVIKEFKKVNPEKEIILTTTTINGREKAKKDLEGIVSLVTLLPLDVNFLIKKFLDYFNFDFLAIMETELWPNLIYYAAKKNITIILINGRISQKSFYIYYFFKFFFKKILSLFSFFIVQNEKMKKRFERLGVDSKKIIILFNIKYSEEQKEIEYIKKINKQDKLIVIAGSIREGEENIIFNVFLKIKDIFNVIFIIAPRHLKRVKYIEKKAKMYNINFKKLSEIKNINESINFDIIIVDTIGDLKKLYSIGDIAIIGGGFKNYGGHNLLEPAYFNLPIIVGKNMYNFEDTVDKMSKDAGVFIASNEEEIFNILKFLIENEEKRKIFGRKNKEILEKMQGTAETTAVILNEILLYKKEGKQ